MVCRNCGADLKPGIKYCLECGSYIDEFEDDDEILDDESSSEYNPAARTRVVTRRKRKKLNLSTTDYLIYGGLLLVMIVSIIVIIVTVAKGNTTSTTPVATATTEKPDEKVTVDNYSVIVPGKLDYTVQSPFLYVRDDNNYSFSFQIKEDDFDNYMNNQGLLKEQLLSNKYEVLSIYDKTINGRNFLIYEIKVDGNKKVLYLTKINSKYTTFGTIDILDSGNWEPSLTEIDVICNSVNFQFE